MADKHNHKQTFPQHSMSPHPPDTRPLCSPYFATTLNMARSMDQPSGWSRRHQNKPTCHEPALLPVLCHRSEHGVRGTCPRRPSKVHQCGASLGAALRLRRKAGVCEGLSIWAGQPRCPSAGGGVRCRWVGRKREPVARHANSIAERHGSTTKHTERRRMRAQRKLIGVVPSWAAAPPLAVKGIRQQGAP